MTTSTLTGDAAAESEFSIELDWIQIIFACTATMTYLTFIKEGAMYQNERHNWRVLIWFLAMKAYYPLLVANLVCLIVLTRQRLREHRASKLLAAAVIVFGLNVVLFSANNVMNLVEGKPLHRTHKGIGW